MKSNPQVNLFYINSIEIIHAPRKSGWSWHAEQRSLSGGSKLIEQTLPTLILKSVLSQFLLFVCEITNAWHALQDNSCSKSPQKGEKKLYHLRHKAFSVFAMHAREMCKSDTGHKGRFQLLQSTVNELFTPLFNGLKIGKVFKSNTWLLILGSEVARFWSKSLSLSIDLKHIQDWKSQVCEIAAFRSCFEWHKTNKVT